MTTSSTTHTGRLAASLRAAALTFVAAFAAVPALAQETVAAANPPPDDRVINKILVKVNGTPIFLTDLAKVEEDRLPLLRQQFPEEEIQAQLPLLRRSLLAALIDERMMLQRADRLGITADANEVDRAVQRLRDANGLDDEEAFEQAVAAMGFTPDEIREEMRKNIRQQRLVFEEVNRGIFVSETEIKRYYDEHPDEFTAPEQIRFEQAVFLLQAGPETEVERQALAALADLRAGTPLADLPSRYPAASVFPADETFIPLPDLNETLAAAVPSLAVDVYSDPVRSQFGFHILRIVERKDYEVLGLEAVSDQIRNRLTNEKSQERMNDYLGRLREDTYVEILDPSYADIEELWKAPPEENVTTGR